VVGMVVSWYGFEVGRPRRRTCGYVSSFVSAWAAAVGAGVDHVGPEDDTAGLADEVALTKPKVVMVGEGFVAAELWAMNEPAKPSRGF